jgi:5-methyltetrahydrofolate--homocysteine methyltransferase
MLRQQVKKREGRANMCLADFIDPEGEDWIGGFAVAIHGIEPHLARFKADNDDYSDILLKALADRLAEASPSGCTAMSARASGAMPASSTSPMPS